LRIEEGKLKKLFGQDSRNLEIERRFLRKTRKKKKRKMELKKEQRKEEMSRLLKRIYQ